MDTAAVVVVVDTVVVATVVVGKASAACKMAMQLPDKSLKVKSLTVSSASSSEKYFFICIIN